MTPKSLIIAGHTGYVKSGVSISELNSFIGCNLRAVVQPEEREGGSRRRAEQNDRAAELHQVCAANFYLYIGDWHCG